MVLFGRKARTDVRELLASQDTVLQDANGRPVENAGYLDSVDALGIELPTPAPVGGHSARDANSTDTDLIFLESIARREFTDQEMATALEVLLDILPATPSAMSFLSILQTRLPQRSLQALQVLMARDLKHWVSHAHLSLTLYGSIGNLTESKILYLLDYMMSK
ncbi:uncharacterized protein LOC127751013 [Frankliniella occidentalis]|uniref:Uncharacterized protein LOC127751013 n=1 Tax=Frankliniella occidentalis TaxID=133901 RepID=A0A9C6X618_FRAOC|nr:uncharacterized protein LOC127751013 [Frankliniella occidentalis]